MAAHTEVEAKHATTTADTVDTVDLTKACQYVMVRNRSATYGLSYTLPRRINAANPALNPTDPTYLGDDTHFLAAGDAMTLDGHEEGVHVEVIGETGQTVAYSVEAF